MEFQDVVRRRRMVRNFDQRPLSREVVERILANGRLDELAYERGNLDTALPLAELRARSDITDKAMAALHEPDFSARIRVDLPLSSRLK